MKSNHSKAGSASVEKDEALDWLAVNCCQSVHDSATNVQACKAIKSHIRAYLAATPSSGGEKWTVRYDPSNGNKPWAVETGYATMWVENETMAITWCQAHQATLPRDCGEDTKRALRYCRKLLKQSDNEKHARAIKLIDAAMKSQP